MTSTKKKTVYAFQQPDDHLSWLELKTPAQKKRLENEVPNLSAAILVENTTNPQSYTKLITKL